MEKILEEREDGTQEAGRGESSSNIRTIRFSERRERFSDFGVSVQDRITRYFVSRPEVPTRAKPLFSGARCRRLDDFVRKKEPSIRRGENLPLKNHALVAR